MSVDIDLLYVPLNERDKAIEEICGALTRLSTLIQKTIKGSKVQNTHEQSDALRLIVQEGEVRIKVELSLVIRGTVFPEVRMQVSDRVEKHFGYAEMQVASLPDLYAGKICAALDRQHPRDLYDIKFLFDNEGLTEDLRKTFLIFLISHQRPMAELLNPHLKDISDTYAAEFVQMAEVEVPLNELEAVRVRLVNEINDQMTDAEKRFLLSFKSRTPDWKLLGMTNVDQIASLPSFRWKMKNLEQMSDKKHKSALEKLEKVLFEKSAL